MKIWNGWKKTFPPLLGTRKITLFYCKFYQSVRILLGKQELRPLFSTGGRYISTQPACSALPSLLKSKTAVVTLWANSDQFKIVYWLLSWAISYIEVGSQYQVIKYALSTMRRKLTIVSHGARMFVMARAYSRIRLARAITLAVLLYGLVDDSHALYKLITHAVKCLSIKCFKYTYYLSCFNVCNEIRN